MNVNMNNTISYIGGSAFEQCTNLKSVHFSNNLRHIDNSAFKNCINLSTITIPDNVTTIGDETFYGCSSITSIVIPQNITIIGKNSFYNCNNLAHITWNATHYTTQINTTQMSPFNGICSNITSFTFGKNIETIPDYICYGMSKLNELLIPNNVTKIGNNAFYNCNNLETILIPNSVTSIGDEAFENCTNLDSIIIGSNVTRIPNKAFYGCSNLSSITIGNKVNEIGNMAFSECTRLLNIEFPNSVKKIGYEAFRNCSRLETITLGTELEAIENYAFEDCKHILDIYSYAKAVPVIEENTFKNVSRKAYVWVPADMVRRYEIDEYWDDFFIKPMEVKVTTTDGNVSVIPGNNNATITWPTSTLASSYTLEITKDGVVFCTLIFNGNGQLTGIAFAPSREGNTHAPSAQDTELGYQFTVTGLDPGTLYSYQIDVKDIQNNSIATYNGTFSTNSTEAINDINVKSVPNPSKILHNGQIFILRGDKTYTLQGQQITL